MAQMEGGGGPSEAQTGRGKTIHFHNRIIEPHNSERSSGAKTPKTPNLSEATPNYNEMYLTSGRNSRERTSRDRDEDGDMSPASYEYYRPPHSTSRSGDNEKRIPVASERVNRSGERKRGEKLSRRKSEMPTEEKRMSDSDEEDDEDEERYKQKYALAGRKKGNSSDIVVASRRSSFPVSNKDQYYERPAEQCKGVVWKSEEFKTRHNRIWDASSSEEESTCTVARRAEADIVPTSEVSNVQQSVPDAKARGKYQDASNDLCDRSAYLQPHQTKDLNQQKAVDAVFTFQHWCHKQLKKLFSTELKKLLEEAKEDEACLANLEQELAIKDKHLAQLRSQLAHYEKASHEQINHKHMHELLGANLQELEKECHKALERARLAEEVLQKRDAEVRRLRGHLDSLEEGVRIDTELKARTKLLQEEKDSAVKEGRVLLAQLARRDEEVTHHCKEVEKLRTTVAKLADQKTSQQNQLENMKAEHLAQVQNLQEKLEEACAAKHSKEMELASFTERCSGLGQERQNLLVQLHRAVERADLASRRAEELQMKLHCTTEERAKASEDVAGEMVDHLKRLTGHMKELEISVDQHGFSLPARALQKKADLAKVSTKLAEAEVAALNLITETDAYEDIPRPVPRQDLEESKVPAFFSSGDENEKERKIKFRSTFANFPLRDDGTSCNNSSIDQDVATTKFKNWTAWKWRWAASAARADNLSKQLQTRNKFSKYDVATNKAKRLNQRVDSSGEKQKVVKMLEFSKVDNPPSDEKKLLALRANRDKLQQNDKKKILLHTNNGFQSRVSEREREKPRLQSDLHISRPSTPAAPVPDVEVQTPRIAEVERKQRTTPGGATAGTLKYATSYHHSPQRVRSQPKTATPCPTCDTYTKSSRSVPLSQQLSRNRELQAPRKLDSQSGEGVNEPTFTTRALRALQTSLQEELKELQYLLSREMQSMQPAASTKAEIHQANGGGADVNSQALKSVFEMCNTLAQELMAVRSQLASGEISRTPIARATRSPWETGEKGSIVRTEEAEDILVGGTESRTKENVNSRPATPRAIKTPRYASPIGREKNSRFNSPSSQPRDSAQPNKPAWSSRPRSLSTSRSLREPKLGAPSMTREMRQFQAQQDRQEVNENRFLSRAQSPQERVEQDEGATQQRYLTSSSRAGRGERVRFTEREREGEEICRDEDDTAMCTPSSTKPPPSSDYTTVVQILNRENSKIGEVAIHTSTDVGGPYDLGGIADLCGSAREAIRTEDQNRQILKGHHDDSQHRPHQQHRMRPQLSEERSYKPPPQYYRSKSASSSPARARAIRPEKPHHQSIVARQVDINRRTDSSPRQVSEKRKGCIGSEYAALLKSEIVRLRDDRLMIENDQYLSTGDVSYRDASPARELTPQLSFLANRPNWKPHYTASSSKK